MDELTDEEEINDDKLNAPVIKDIAGNDEVIAKGGEYEKTDMPSIFEKKAKKLNAEKLKIN